LSNSKVICKITKENG